MFAAEVQHYQILEREQRRRTALAETGARYVSPSEAPRSGEETISALRREGFLDGAPD